MNDLENLKNLVLAPYILKSTALISVHRKVGGNQFRHSFSTLGILFDYKYYDDSVLLKASLLHDFLEEFPDLTPHDISGIDHDSPQVVDLVLEVTRRQEETKAEYLERVLEKGSRNALILKCADRISNLTDLNRDSHSAQKISEYLKQTEKYVFEMAKKVDKNMLVELKDLVAWRWRILDITDTENNRS
jgi:(p)ppGpp synthase/HD superfamily hydrolase